MRKIFLITIIILGTGLFYANAQTSPQNPSTPLPKAQDKVDQDMTIPDPTRPDTTIIDSGPGAIVDTMSIPDSIGTKTNLMDKKSDSAPMNKPNSKATPNKTPNSTPSRNKKVK